MGEAKLKEKLHCQVCGRQFVSVDESTDVTICKEGAVVLVNGYCCVECSSDLDENGLFPREGYEKADR